MKFTRLIALLSLSMLLASCSQYNQLLKSKDNKKKYSEALRYYYQKDYKRSITLFEHVISDMIGTDQADTIIFYSGKAQYQTRDYDMAAQMMDLYRKEFPSRSFSEEAEYLLGMSYYKLSPPAERDQSNTHKAMVAFNEYLSRHPESIKAPDIKEILESLQQKLYYKDFVNTSLYYKLSAYPASVTALRSSLKTNPDTPYREEMMYLICKSWYNYARNSIEARKLDRYMKMVDSYYNFVSEYPDSKQFIRELDKMFTESKTYVDKNRDATLSLERNRIEITSIKERLAIEKAKLETGPRLDKTDRARVKEDIKVLRTQLTNEEKVVKAGSKALKKNNAKSKNVTKSKEAKRADHADPLQNPEL